MIHRCPRCDREQAIAGNCRRCAPNYFVSVRPVPEPKREAALPPAEAVFSTGEPCHFCSRPYPAPVHVHDNPKCERYTGPKVEPWPRREPEFVVSVARRPRAPFPCLGRAFALAMMEWGGKR